MFDITADVGPLDTISNGTAISMYSFERPSRIVWDAIGEELHAQGWTRRQIKEWLQSRDARWALDFALGDALRKAAKHYAKTNIR